MEQIKYKVTKKKKLYIFFIKNMGRLCYPLLAYTFAYDNIYRVTNDQLHNNFN